MGRRPRAAARAAAASLRTETPPLPEGEPERERDGSDDEVGEAALSNASTPPAKDTSTHDSDAPSDRSTAGRGSSSQARKRRLGRAGKTRAGDWEAADDKGADEAGSEAGTPFKRRRGRPSTGGGRWAKARGGPSHVTQVPIDKEGNMMDVIDDEVAMPEDALGESKVDRQGYLQGGRQYRCRTFTIQGRKGRLYMLSTEPARCIGFRDSYLFFQKHKQLYKIIIDEPAKRDLIERELIPHSYKGRAIGVVTARSVFREFGARIVVGGRWVEDDYQSDAVDRVPGAVPGELADPTDHIPKPGEKYNQNQYVAWHGASSVYHSGMPSVPVPTGKGAESKKRKVVVTDVNWMLEHAREASRFNAVLAACRRANVDGVYDPHTNLVHFPKSTQPTHARWERLPRESEEGDEQGRQLTDAAAPSGVQTMFSRVPANLAQNALVVDTVLVGPSSTSGGLPGLDGHDLDLSATGLTDVADQVMAELPAACRLAFEQARSQELDWKRAWSQESEDGARGRLRIGF